MPRRIRDATATGIGLLLCAITMTIFACAALYLTAHWLAGL